MVVDFVSCTFASWLNCFVHFGCLAATIRDDWFWWHLDLVLRGLARDLVDGRLSLLELFLVLRLLLLLLLFEHVFFTAIRGVCPGLPAWKGSAHPGHVFVLLILLLPFLL